jgi:hypothetical protein
VAFIGPTTVTWNASTCAAGIYTVVAVALGPDGVKTYSVTTKNVSLPKASVVQQFPDLPPGTYRVSAQSTAADGRVFWSEAQTIEGQGDGSIRYGRSRPAANPPTGFARPRVPPAAPEPPREPRSVAPLGAVPVPARAVPAESAREQLVRRLLLTLDPDGSDPTWRAIAFEDSDGDGALDVVVVESIAGGIVVMRIDRSPLR